MASSNATKGALPNPFATPVPDAVPGGLTSAEDSSRLQKNGPNAMPDTSSGHRALFNSGHGQDLYLCSA